MRSERLRGDFSNFSRYLSLYVHIPKNISVNWNLSLSKKFSNKTTVVWSLYSHSQTTYHWNHLSVRSQTKYPWSHLSLCISPFLPASLSITCPPNHFSYMHSLPIATPELQIMWIISLFLLLYVCTYIYIYIYICFLANILLDHLSLHSHTFMYSRSTSRMMMFERETQEIL